MSRVVLLVTAMAMALLLASGVAFAAITCGGGYCQGNNNDNKIHGTSGLDEIYGRGGGDTIYGKEGPDLIRGDWHQWLDPGEPGNDTIYGGYGNDRLQGDERTDTLKGGPGNDHINAETDGELDYVDCGKGTEDVAFFDRGIDEVSNCEIRNPPVG